MDYRARALQKERRGEREGQTEGEREEKGDGGTGKPWIEKECGTIADIKQHVKILGVGAAGILS